MLDLARGERLSAYDANYLETRHAPRRPAGNQGRRSRPSGPASWRDVAASRVGVDKEQIMNIKSRARLSRES